MTWPFDGMVLPLDPIQWLANPASIAYSQNVSETIESSNPDDLLRLVYDELRKLAADRLAGEKPGHTLQPTALVHEAWIRLSCSNQQWRDGSHFFGAAAEAMRRGKAES